MAMTQSKSASSGEDQLRAKYEAEKNKRLRPDGDGQYLEATGAFEEFAKDPYAGDPEPRASVSEEVDVAIIGCGFGGLLTAANLRKAGIDAFRMFDQASDFGGTWYWNRYPGVRCDIESLIYLPFLEEVGTVPKERYASGGEIYAHCQALGRHFDLYKQALFQTKVTGIRWDEKLARWIVRTDRGDTVRARFVTVSQGPLSKMKLPGIPGIRSFKGRMFHSSRWDFSYTGGSATGGLTKLGDKKVGLIGTGATGVQIVPVVSEYAKELFVFQRTPSAIDVRNNEPLDPAWFAGLPQGWQDQRMENFLAILSSVPQDQDLVSDQWTDFWKRLSALMARNKLSPGAEHPQHLMQIVDDEKMNELRARVDDVVEDPATAEALKPWYNYLCKRPLFSDRYLKSFNKPNVHLIDTQGKGVEAITERGIVANGAEFALDCIVFATGFDVGAAAYRVGGYEVVGRNGLSIDQKWSADLRTVHGTQLNGFPNFHIVGGFAQGTTAFNFMHALSIQAEHAVDLIARCVSRNIAVMEVTAEAEARWLALLEENRNMALQRYFEDCTPGFLNNEGDTQSKPSFLGGNFGGGTIKYRRLIRDWRENELENDTAIRYAETEA